MSTRREREKEGVQRRILDAARELLVSEGQQAVTMRRIAERIDYTPTALYFHFRDKDTLLRRVVAEDYAALAARLRVLARVPDPLERLRLLFHAIVVFTAEHAAQVRCLPTTVAAGEAPDRGAYRALLQCVTEAMDAGQLRRGPGFAALAAQTLWAGAHGTATFTEGGGAEDPVAPLERRSEAMIETLLRGMAPLKPERISGRRSG
jgi:AcrR family transcriptional regulator